MAIPPECIPSSLISKAKHRRAWLVLGWEKRDISQVIVMINVLNYNSYTKC